MTNGNLQQYRTLQFTIFKDDLFLYTITSHYFASQSSSVPSRAVRHCYCSEKELYSGIALSNFTFGWRFAQE